MPALLRRCRTRLMVLCLVALALGGLASVVRAEPVTIEPQSPRIDLSDRLTLLRDPERRLHYTEAYDRLKEFTPVKRAELVTSFNPGVFWLHVTLLNGSPLPVTRWLTVGTAKTQRVTLHMQEGNDWVVMNSGRSIAAQDQPVAALDPLFPVTLAPGEQRDLLLRVDSRGATDMATTLWEPHVYRHASSDRLMKLAALIGGLLVSSALALMVFAYLRETQYLWLGLMLIAVASLEAARENLLGTYFWPAAYALPPQTLSLSAALALFSLAKVVAHALDLAQRLRAAHHLLRGLRWITVAGGLLSLFSYGHGVLILSMVTVTLHIATLALSMIAWRRGHTAARIFLLAFSLALLTETARQLANLGLLPWIAAMDFSMFFFLLASPLILLGLAEQTRQLTERLHVAEQLQQAKSAFLARISHELRSPLNTILGFNRMLARHSGKLSLAEGTAGIEKSTLRLLRLIDELLDEARAAAGKLTIAPAPMALQPWLGEIAATARIAIEESGNRLVCEFAGDFPPMIEADGERLRQVLENLLANANRHTRQGTIRLLCWAKNAGTEVMLDFAVEDNGEGIALERLPSIFEPFVSGAAPSAGHGLGLPICRELIRQMGGDITVTSTPEQGCRFAFSLRCPIITTPMPAQSLPSSTKDTLPRQDRPRVLLVDDDEIQLGLLAELLEDAGFDVTTAPSGRAAVAQLDQASFAVMITDQMMPGIDGWSVLQHARNVRPGLPVIMLSAAPPCRPAGMPAAIDFDATLLKPASSEAVLATAWHQAFKGDIEASPISRAQWQSLAQLASEGDVSGIEDWITACRKPTGKDATTRHAPLLDWVEGNLHRLSFSMLERFAVMADRTLPAEAAARDTASTA